MDKTKKGVDVVLLVEQAINDKTNQYALLNLLKENPAFGDFYIGFLSNQIEINLKKISLISLTLSHLVGKKNEK